MKITLWQRIRKWCKDSETLALARLQMLAGVLVTVIVAFDPSVLAPILGDKWFGPFLLGWGILTEVARRYRATDL